MSFFQLCNQFFRLLECVHGMFVRLFGEFVGREVVSLVVCDCGGSVGMGSKVVQFCHSIMCALWHEVSP
jgi:hypothetical protein